MPGRKRRVEGGRGRGRGNEEKRRKNGKGETLYTPPVEVRANQEAGKRQRARPADAQTPINDTTRPIQTVRER